MKGKAIQRIGAEMCQVHDADLSEFEVRVETETIKGGTVKLVKGKPYRIHDEQRPCLFSFSQFGFEATCQHQKLCIVLWQFRTIRRQALVSMLKQNTTLLDLQFDCNDAAGLH